MHCRKCVFQKMIILLAIAWVTSTCPVQAQEDAADGASASVVVTEWLRLGPIQTPFPAFVEGGKKKRGASDLLGYEHIDRARLHPVTDAPVDVVGHDPLR